ncbi:epididymal-specific lipocalin-5-like isoform X2 [Eptesicus fuscus]|uniref:epididymal-specific lipocalin-5-like isoform X2 n=1 Tax=Eptesicus fuscus TaxID=29078 RepID=UPI002404823D|nr:epididymal-specific lipocalin-5-like isoform X2 [Eptesicus fuscus]
MKGPALLALLGLCVTLAAGRRSSVVKDFDFEKFSGFWYEIAFASKLHEPKARKVVAVLVEWEGGHLALTTSHEDETGCVKDKRLAMKGDVPGKFKLPKEFGSPVHSPQGGPFRKPRRPTPLLRGDKEISVVSTDYETYAIMDVQLHRGAASIGVLKLYSRALEHDKEVLKKFHQAAKDYGLSPKDVHLNTWDMTCANLLRPGGEPSS